MIDLGHHLTRESDRAAQAKTPQEKKRIQEGALEVWALGPFVRICPYLSVLLPIAQSTP